MKYDLPPYTFNISPDVIDVVPIPKTPLVGALTYAILASAMPRAGGSYVYASRSIHPFWGFIASFAQWFGLSIVIGVVSYMVVPFFRDVCAAMDWINLVHFFENSNTKLFLSLGLLWLCIGVNIFGVKTYQLTIISWCKNW